MKRVRIFGVIGVIIMIAVLAGCAGTPPSETATIPDGSYVGRFIRNDQAYTATVEIKAGGCVSIQVKYNGTPMEEEWAKRQIQKVIEENSTQVPVVPSPARRNRAILTAIDLALKSGLEMAR